MMRTEQKVTLGVTALTVIGLMTTAWMQGRPASAQDDLSRATPRGGQGGAGGGQGARMMIGGGPAPIAATADSVYVLRGNTLYQIKSSDLSLVTQKNLPGGPGRGNGGFLAAVDRGALVARRVALADSKLESIRRSVSSSSIIASANG